MQKVLDTIGIADAVIAYERDDGQLQMIDGHMRQDIAGDDELPVLILDVNEKEAQELLLTLDPLSAMAETDEHQLEALILSLTLDSDLADLLADIGKDYGLDTRGFDDLQMPDDLDAGDFNTVQLILQMPKHRHTPDIENAVRKVADQFGVSLKVHGVRG